MVPSESWECFFHPSDIARAKLGADHPDTLRSVLHFGAMLQAPWHDAMVVSEHVFFLVESLLISLNHVMICHDKRSQAIKVT